jgi:hypothetical protein
MFKQRAGQIRAATVAAVLLLAILAPATLAADYSFQVQATRVDLYIDGDGTVDIVYDITFANDPGAAPMDIIDVGMPNSTYNPSRMQASIDGVSISDISESPYMDDGVAVDLGSHAIPPGGTGTLHLEATVRSLIYQDSEDAEYASIEFSPNWFSSDFVHGSTYLEVNFHLPPGVTPEEPRYHKVEFTDAYVKDGRVVYTWSYEDAQPDRQ